MDAVKFLEEKARICRSSEDCTSCLLSSDHNSKCMHCTNFMNDYPQEAVELVEKWSAEHPRKTMMQDFFEKFPKAQKRSDGLPSTCPFALGYCEDSRCPSVGKDFVSNCLECWSRPLED